MSIYKIRQAFSLLELSLVIIVIALLVSASTSGLKIVRKAQIQSSIKKIFSYKYAYNEFVLTYQALPGDIDNAHTYFDDGTDEICGESGNCNGDGDGILELSEKTNSEIYRAWQHLYLANMVETAFDGVWGETNSVPKASLNDSKISFDYDADLFTNILRLGSYSSLEGGDSYGGIVTSKEARTIDVKYDDGNADSGKIIGYDAYYVDSGNVTQSDYCLNGSLYKTYNSTDNACSLGFLPDK